MAKKSETADETTTDVATADAADAPGESGRSGDVYVLPVLHTEVPSRLVNVGFWGGLGGAVLVGAVDLPLGVLLGVGVAVARHNTRRKAESD